MRSPMRQSCAPVCFASLLLTLLVAGCGPAVREDRSINFAGDGSAVGFHALPPLDESRLVELTLNR